MKQPKSTGNWLSLFVSSFYLFFFPLLIKEPATVVGRVFLAQKLRYKEIKQFLHHKSNHFFFPFLRSTALMGQCPFKKNIYDQHILFSNSKVQSVWFTIPVFLAKSSLAVVKIQCVWELQDDSFVCQHLNVKNQKESAVKNNTKRKTEPFFFSSDFLGRRNFHQLLSIDGSTSHGLVLCIPCTAATNLHGKACAISYGTVRLGQANASQELT